MNHTAVPSLPDTSYSLRRGRQVLLHYHHTSRHRDTDSCRPNHRGAHPPEPPSESTTQEHWLEIQNIFNSEVPDACASGGGGGRGREGEPKNPGLPNHRPTPARRRRDSAVARESGAGSSPAPDSSPSAPPLHFPQYINAPGPSPQANPAIWADLV